MCASWSKWARLAGSLSLDIVLVHALASFVEVQPTVENTAGRLILVFSSIYVSLSLSLSLFAEGFISVVGLVEPNEAQRIRTLLYFTQ